MYSVPDPDPGPARSKIRISNPDPDGIRNKIIFRHCIFYQIKMLIYVEIAVSKYLLSEIVSSTSTAF